MGAPVDGDQPAVLAEADPGPDPDRRVRAEFGVRHLQGDAEDVGVRHRVLAGPGEVVDDPFEIGEEGIAAQPDRKPVAVRLHHVRRVAERHRDGGEQHVAGGLVATGGLAGRTVHGDGLAAGVGAGEGERVGDVGPVVAVAVDVDPVDRVRVELGGLGGGVRVHVHDEDGPAGRGGRREREQVGEVQPGVTAGRAEVGAAEVVGHGTVVAAPPRPAREDTRTAGGRPPIGRRPPGTVGQ